VISTVLQLLQPNRHQLAQRRLLRHLEVDMDRRLEVRRLLQLSRHQLDLALLLWVDLNRRLEVDLSRRLQKCLRLHFQVLERFVLK
jgi:hypothetical protein